MKSFEDVNRLFREMDRQFDQLRRAMFDAPAFGFDARYPALEGSSGFEATTPYGRPGTSLEDEGDAFVFVMDLPGFEKDDIELTFEDGTLSISASAEREEGDDAFRTMRSRHVAERVRVPREVIVEEIEANYRNGVLEVRLPTVDVVDDDSVHRIDVE
ncbi:Hsp20/alpha crystallin family protein [Natrialbaceae archaeon GCM10025810]|uniref:Hsp20/alpha crystallin family protein n=1 Tax=Halovalidus salilacus TaxID=3075124 RepID=UPI00361FDC3F